jgi:hypothetical protein
MRYAKKRVATDFIIELQAELTRYSNLVPTPLHTALINVIPLGAQARSVLTIPFRKRAFAGARQKLFGKRSFRLVPNETCRAPDSFLDHLIDKFIVG